MKIPQKRKIRTDDKQKPFTNGDLFKLLENDAKDYIKNHEWSQDDGQVDLLVDFINYVAYRCGGDLGLGKYNLFDDPSDK